jgi:hypothetical protein
MQVQLAEALLADALAQEVVLAHPQSVHVRMPAMSILSMGPHRRSQFIRK